MFSYDSSENLYKYYLQLRPSQVYALKYTSKHYFTYRANKLYIQFFWLYGVLLQCLFYYDNPYTPVCGH